MHRRGHRYNPSDGVMSMTTTTPSDLAVNSFQPGSLDDGGRYRLSWISFFSFPLPQILKVTCESWGSLKDVFRYRLDAVSQEMVDPEVSSKIRCTKDSL